MMVNELQEEKKMMEELVRSSLTPQSPTTEETAEPEQPQLPQVVSAQDFFASPNPQTEEKKKSD